MARTIAPGTPAETKAQHFDVNMPDFSLLEKMGDAKIKLANENFKLYAEVLIKSESQKLYDQFKDDPINLTNALSKLPDMLSGLPEEIQTDMQKTLYLNSVSLVSKAKTNQENKTKREYKTNAMIDANLTLKQMSEDYFNVLQYVTAPSDEKRDVDLDIYNMNRAKLVQLANLTDEDGKPLFTETQKEKMIMPSEAVIEGFRNFIYRGDEKQLKDWDKNVFSNRDKFIKDTGIDGKTYDSLEKVFVARLKQLKDTSIRKIKTQAMLDTASLLTSADDKEKIDNLRKQTDAPKGLIDRLVKLNDSIIKSNWYNPAQQSDPTGIYEVLSTMSDIVKDNDTSPDGLERKIEKAVDVLDTVAKNGAKYNISDGEIQQLRDWIYKAIADESFAKNLQMIDIPFVNAVVEARKQELATNYAMHQPKALEEFESELEAYHKQGKLHPLEKSAAKSVLESMEHGYIDRESAHRLAYNNFKMGLAEAINYLEITGDVNAAKSMLDQAKYNYIKTYNSDWIPEYDFDKLQLAFEKGQKAEYYHNGILFEYQGYQNDGAIFKAKM